MTSDGALDVFAASLSAVTAPDPRVAAVLLSDQLVLAGPRAQAGSAGLDVARAAAAAMAGSADDADDVHWGALVHPGAIIWPTVLEAGLAQHAGGTEILRAAAIGHEAMMRLALAIGPIEGFHLTAVVGGVGAAAAASALLEGAVSADALGHALSVAGGSSGAILERSGTRSFHRGHAVRTGVSAALAARDGLRATRADLETGGGVLAARGGLPVEALVDDVAGLAGTSLRPLPASGWNHPAYEAAREAGSTAVGTITRITVAVPESARRASSGATSSAAEAWHDLGHSVARAVASVRDGQTVEELLAVVRIVDRAEPGASVVVEAGGRSTSADVTLPLGHPRRPLTSDDLARKWGTSVPLVESLLDGVATWLATPTSAPLPVPAFQKEQ